ncbi:MAG: HD domain-containing phosphohydrolase [Desulfuromonadales bacterium]
MRSKPLILVVDDMAGNLRLMKTILEPLGYEVTTALDGEEAMAAVRNDAPDLILIDAMMPHMDGFETTRRLKASAETKIIPIIMVTDLNRVEDKVKALEAGVDDFLTKPVDKIEMKTRVAALLKVKAFNDHMLNYQKELEAELDNRTKSLKEAFGIVRTTALDTINHLSRAAAFKDGYSRGHVLRMSNFAAAIARYMGMTERAIESLLHAAPLHDVGKIGVPDQILLKPGKLDPEEWNIVRQHAAIGGKILENADTTYIKLGEMIALTHHEKWDGTGYPKGLKGDEIPLAGRITAISDVFDSLISKRPYREARTIEEAFYIIKEGDGTHFDPKIVKAFFASEKTILSIKARHPVES